MQLQNVYRFEVNYKEKYFRTNLLRSCTRLFTHTCISRARQSYSTLQHTLVLDENIAVKFSFTLSATYFSVFITFGLEIGGGTE